MRCGSCATATRRGQAQDWADHGSDERHETAGVRVLVGGHVPKSMAQRNSAVRVEGYRSTVGGTGTHPLPAPQPLELIVSSSTTTHPPVSTPRPTFSPRHGRDVRRAAGRISAALAEHCPHDIVARSAGCGRGCELRRLVTRLVASSLVLTVAVCQLLWRAPARGRVLVVEADDGSGRGAILTDRTGHLGVVTVLLLVAGIAAGVGGLARVPNASVLALMIVVGAAVIAAVAALTSWWLQAGAGWWGEALYSPGALGALIATARRDYRGQSVVFKPRNDGVRAALVRHGAYPFARDAGRKRPRLRLDL